MLCKPVQLRELGEQSDCVFGSCSGGIGSVSSKPSPALLCSALPLCSHTHTPRLPLAPLWALPAAGLGAGAGGAQQRAAIWLRGGQVRAGTRPLPSSSVSCLQLNITAWASQDGGFLHMERLRLSGQSTEHRLPTYGPGTRYVVAVRGLTAAGPGAASLWESHTNGSGEGLCTQLLLLPLRACLPMLIVGIFLCRDPRAAPWLLPPRARYLSISGDGRASPAPHLPAPRGSEVSTAPAALLLQP